MSWTYLIFSRWVHVTCACLLVGGTFFFAFLWPSGSEASAALTGDPVRRPVRKRFKILVHSTSLFLLLSGIYNAINNWGAYHRNIPLTHALFGPHLLLGLLIFVILFVVLARKQPSASEGKWLRAAVILTFVTVLIASALKYAREHPKTTAEGQTGLSVNKP